MAFIITSSCQNEKSGECMEVCPVNCIEEGETMFYIDPGVCIDCGACESVCPTNAIYTEEEVPEEEIDCISMNRKFFESE